MMKAYRDPRCMGTALPSDRELSLSHRSRLASFYTRTDQPQPIDAIGPDLRSVHGATSRAALSSCARCRTIAVQVRNRLSAYRTYPFIKDKEVSPTHGWRHSFKQIADRHNISERVHDAITDHAPPSQGRGYGAPTLDDMAEALKQFPRFKVG
jgi:hypothetical protein